MPISTITTNSLGSTAQIGSLTTASGSAPSYSARAWVNFNGTNTVAIRASGNVSSITDNGTGDYTVNFTTAMPDANYSFGVNRNYAGIPEAVAFARTAQTASSLRVITGYTYASPGYQDSDAVSVQIFR